MPVLFPKSEITLDGKLSNKERLTVKILMLIGAFGALICWIGFDYFPFIPSGKVIDESFLNALKWMTVAKYAVLIAFVALTLFPILIVGFKHENSRDRIIIISIIVVTLVILGFVIAPHFKGAYRGVVDTPSVSTNVVSSKHYSREGKTYNVHFEDDTYAHCSAYQYGLVEPGDEVYVVTCDGEAIGVFKTDEYTLHLES